MKRLVLAGLVLLFFGFIGFCLGADAQNVVLIRAGRLFDGKSDQLLSNQAIVIEGDRIADVEPADSIKVPPGAVEIDLRKATVLPGLIDAHAHMLKSKRIGLTAENFLKYSWQYRTILATVNVKTDLEAGFTTERDCMSAGARYSDTDVRRAVNEGIIPGPRLQVATVALMGTSWGEGYSKGGASPEVIAPLGLRLVDSPWEGRKAVREDIKYGADLIKLFMGFGHELGPDGRMVAHPTMSQEEEAAIVDEAHRQGVKAACNAEGGEALWESVEVGCDSIELASELDPEAVQAMAQKGTYVTFALYRHQIQEDANVYGFGEKSKPGWYSRVELQKASFQRALKAGVKIAFATNPGQVDGPDHGKQAKEFEFMVNDGMTPLQALRAATSVNAELMGWQDRVGSIEKGKYADFIAVSGNPLEDITELERVKFVMKGGVTVRNDLSSGSERTAHP